MALGELIFHDAVRVNPAPCGHFEVQLILSDGSQRSHSITLEELEALAEKMSRVIGSGPGSGEIALAVLWLSFQVSAGATIPQLQDAVIAGPPA